MSGYHAEIVNLSLNDVHILKKFNLLSVQKRFLGLVKIYTVSISSNDINQTINLLQKNMSKKLKKEWYITIHNEQRVIVVFRNKIFNLSGKGIVAVRKKMIDTSHAEEKTKWDKMIAFAKSLGIPDAQCDFLPEDFSTRHY